jgi:hypothetical protein
MACIHSCQTVSQASFREQGLQDSISSHTREHNGKAEQLNPTLAESEGAMVYQVNLSIDFWFKAIETAAFVLNLFQTLPHPRCLSAMSPFP